MCNRKSDRQSPHKPPFLTTSIASEAHFPHEFDENIFLPDHTEEISVHRSQSQRSLM